MVKQKGENPLVLSTAGFSVTPTGYKMSNTMKDSD